MTAARTIRAKASTKRGRKELRWAKVEAAWGAVRSDPHWKAQYEKLKIRGKHSNEAIVAIARKLLVSIWHVLTNTNPIAFLPMKTWPTR